MSTFHPLEQSNLKNIYLTAYLCKVFQVLGQLSTPWSQHQLKSVQLHREQPLQQGGILQMQSLMIFHPFSSRQW